MMKTSIVNMVFLRSALLALCLLLVPPCPEAQARIVIDIVKAPRKLPIAVQELSGAHGKEISEIIKADLASTGLFLTLDNAAFIEYPGHAFKRNNWTAIGAEAVVKGFVKVEDLLKVTVHTYDVFEGKPVMMKLYTGGEADLRTLAHTIANDIYENITNQKGVFTTQVAFIADNGGAQELHIMDWDGGRRVSLGVSAAIMLTPHWSSDANKLLYSAQRDNRWEIFLLDLATMEETGVFSSVGTNMAGDMFPGSEEFGLSASRHGTPDIYIYNIPESKLTRLTREMGIEVSPAVSPDGKTIAYVSDRGGSPQIYTMNKIGYNRVRITFESKYNTAPTWSPRGDRLAFSGVFDGRNQIYTAKPDGSGLKLLTEIGNNEDPSFSPDGRHIVFTSDRDGRRGIYMMRSNGEEQRRITPRTLTANSPRWAPR
jgi:TolB protein